MIAVVDAVVVYVAVYLVEHMDTNGLYLGLFGVFRSESSSSWFQRVDFCSTFPFFLFSLHSRTFVFSFSFLTFRLSRVVACLCESYWLLVSLLMNSFWCYGIWFMCAHSCHKHMCLPLWDEQSIEIYYIAATMIHRTIINIYMRVCLCQTFNWQPYQITGSLFHRRSLEKVEFELRSEW